MNLDMVVSKSYLETSYQEEQKMRKELMKLIPYLTRGKSKNEILRIFKMELEDATGFEKNGCFWLPLLGLKFEGEELIHVSPNSNSGEFDPCFPE